MSRLVVRGSACLFLFALAATSARAADPVDLTHATVVIQSGNLPAAEKIAPVILAEEIAKRSGVSWPIATRWPASGKNSAVIAICGTSIPAAWATHLPIELLADLKSQSRKAEGFHIRACRLRARGRRRFWSSATTRGRDVRRWQTLAKS